MINSPSILKTLTVKRIQARLHAYHMYHFTTGLPFANINIKRLKVLSWSQETNCQLTACHGLSNKIREQKYDIYKYVHFIKRYKYFENIWHFGTKNKVFDV